MALTPTLFTEERGDIIPVSKKAQDRVLFSVFIFKLQGVRKNETIDRGAKRTRGVFIHGRQFLKGFFLC